MVDDTSSAPEPKPRLMLVSAGCGAVGVVLLLLGAVFDSNPLFFAGLIAGCVSLVVALTWRSELITSWREQQGPPKGR